MVRLLVIGNALLVLEHVNVNAFLRKKYGLVFF
jgi:hypothetical protein